MIRAPSTQEHAVAVLAEVRRLGVTLRVTADGVLQARPVSLLTDAVHQRIRRHRTDVIALLRSAPSTSQSSAALFGPGGAIVGCQSSARTDREACSPALWGESELSILARAGVSPADLPVTSSLKAVFSDEGMTITSITREHGRGGSVRRHAARLIHQPGCPHQRRARRDAWRERMAICIIDGSQTEPQAEAMALRELEDEGSMT